MELIRRLRTLEELVRLLEIRVDALEKSHFQGYGREDPRPGSKSEGRKPTR